MDNLFLLIVGKKKISFCLLVGDFVVVRDSRRSGVFNFGGRVCNKYILGIGCVCGGVWGIR